MEKRVLITGAAGFIGFHATLALKAKGYLAVGLDNFNSYYTPSLKKKRAQLLSNEGIDVVEGDIVDKEFLKTLIEKYRFTHILHLAAQAGVRYAMENPEAYLKSNLEGFLSILETVRQNPKIKLTFASSSSVYGLNEKTPFSTTDRTDLPANLYAATKKANELMAYSYHSLYGIHTVGLRFFTVYGPWGRPDMAYFLFADAIRNEKPIRLFNQGEMSRDFTYIDDAVDGILKALDCNEPYDIFNIGNNRPEPILSLVEILEKGLEKKAIKVFEKMSQGEVKTTFADIEYSKKKLLFNPKTTLEEGMKKFITWYREEWSS